MVALETSSHLDKQFAFSFRAIDDHKAAHYVDKHEQTFKCFAGLGISNAIHLALSLPEKNAKKNLKDKQDTLRKKN